MEWSTAVGLTGPCLFFSVFLVKAGYWFGLWQDQQNTRSSWAKLDSTVTSLRETVSEGFDRVSNRIDQLRKELTDIRENYVAKGECGEIHRRLEARQDNLEKRVTDLEKEQ